MTNKILSILKKRIHILQWLPKYTRNDIIADFIAGLTVGLTMMPQSIAYAGLAGLPPQYGLYTAFIGSFTYVFFGTIKEVSIGPTSLMSILTFQYVHDQPIEVVLLLSFIAGCVELLMGVLKLGFLVDFISPCLTSGFTSASALIIIIAQMKHLLGIKVKSHDTFNALIETTEQIPNIKLADAALGASSIIFLFLFKQLPKIRTRSAATKKAIWFLSISKNALIVLITSIVGFVLHEYYGGSPFKLTGPVPKGLPAFRFPSFSAQTSANETLSFSDMAQSLGSGMFVVPVVAILANVAIAKSFSDDIVDASQEMITLGISNIFGSCVQAMPSCGAFTRSAVASSSGVRTPLQGIYSGTIIILALGFLAPYFFYIPKATLSAVLITAACSLIDYEIYPVLWRLNKFDFFISLLTFCIAIVFSVELSIIVGVALNALVLLKKWTRPSITTEIRTLEKSQYIYIKPELGLYYPAADFLIETIRKFSKSQPNVPIVLDCANILSVDYAAVKTIQGLLETYNKTHVQIELLNVQPKILESLEVLIDTSKLHLCNSHEQLCNKIFSNNKSGDVESPLLVQAELEECLRNGRKKSLYDNV